MIRFGRSEAIFSTITHTHSQVSKAANVVPYSGELTLHRSMVKPNTDRFRIVPLHVESTCTHSLEIVDIIVMVHGHVIVM